MSLARRCRVCGCKYFRGPTTEQPDDLCRFCWKMSLLTPMGDWVRDAECARIGGDVWFSDVAPTREYEIAKAICKNDCPVRQQCLDWAVENKIRAGLWGGMSPNERRPLERRKDAS